MNIKKVLIFDEFFYLDFDNGQCSKKIEDLLFFLDENDLTPPEYSLDLYKKITICIESTDMCNFNCKYCFNKQKGNFLFKYDKKLEYILNSIFERYKNSEKFFIDLSGDGEPLLNINFIKKLIDYVEKKQEEIRKEINISFVCNGSLLEENIVNFLQKNGIIFGVSFDGPRQIHNKNRINADGSKTYDLILNNIKKIKHKEFLGAAVSLTNDVFDLTKNFIEFLNYFGTISYKFVRYEKENKLTDDAVDKWIYEYNKLASFLVSETLNRNFRPIFSLLSGDDYFGKFLCLSFKNNLPFNRCDAGVGRIFINQNYDIFPCAPLAKYSNYRIGNGLFFNEDFLKYIYYDGLNKSVCSKCDFVKLCGGECIVEKEINLGVNSSMCKIKKHLVLLSKYFFLKIKESNYCFEKIQNFIDIKFRTTFMDDMYKKIVNKYKDKTFKECKEYYYRMINQDKNQHLFGSVNLEYMEEIYEKQNF